MDTIEDNSEIIKISSESIEQRLRNISQNFEEVPTFECKICHRFFFASIDVNNHVFSEHRHDANYSEYNSESNQDSEEISFWIEDSRINEINEIFNHLQNMIEGNDRSVDNHWSIHSRNLRNRDLYTSQEERYFSGCLDYLMGHDLEVNRPSKNSNPTLHFENAYGKLRHFSILLAQQICRIIAFKLSWFKQFNEVPRSSLFYLVGHFYTHSYEEVTISQDYTTSDIRNSDGVIIDDFHHKLIIAINDYFMDRLRINNVQLHDLEKLAMQTRNPNHFDKLLLLKARLNRDCQIVEEAKLTYRKIRFHPVFGLEADSYISSAGGI